MTNLRTWVVGGKSEGQHYLIRTTICLGHGQIVTERRDGNFGYDK